MLIRGPVTVESHTIETTIKFVITFHLRHFTVLSFEKGVLCNMSESKKLQNVALMLYVPCIGQNY